MQRTILAIAALVATGPAAAATVEYPVPVAVPHGLILTLGGDGRPSFNPADGVHQLLGGKTAPERHAEAISWGSGSDVMGAQKERRSRPTFSLSPGLIDNPACDRAQGRPPFCDMTPGVPENPTTVSVPAAIWLLLTGFGAMAIFKRKDEQ